MKQIEDAIEILKQLDAELSEPDQEFIDMRETMYEDQQRMRELEDMLREHRAMVLESYHANVIASNTADNEADHIKFFAKADEASFMLNRIDALLNKGE